MDSLWAAVHLAIAWELVFDLALYFFIVIYCRYCLLFGCHILPLLFEVSHVDRIIVCGVLSCNITCLHYLVISTTLVRGSIDATAVRFCIQLSGIGLWWLWGSVALKVVGFGYDAFSPGISCGPWVCKHRSRPSSGWTLNRWPNLALVFHVCLGLLVCVCFCCLRLSSFSMNLCRPVLSLVPFLLWLKVYQKAGICI